jgi:hypothetical protein
MTYENPQPASKVWTGLLAVVFHKAVRLLFTAALAVPIILSCQKINP